MLILGFRDCYIEKKISYIDKRGILLKKELNKPFDEFFIYSFVRGREIVDEEGYNISERDIDRQSLKISIRIRY